MSFWKDPIGEISGRSQKKRDEKALRESQQRAEAQRQADISTISGIEKKAMDEVLKVQQEGAEEIGKILGAGLILVIIVLLLLWIF